MPVRDLLLRLTDQDIPAPAVTVPLERLAECDSLSIAAAPDPEEEVRTVVRSIAADDLPFHRTAVIYRQDNPYAMPAPAGVGLRGNTLFWNRAPDPGEHTVRPAPAGPRGHGG